MKAGSVRASNQWTLSLWSEIVELSAHHHVVVVAAGVACDRATRLGAAVVEADDECRTHARLRTSRVAAQLGTGTREVVHLAREAATEPRVELARRVCRAEGRDAHEVEPESERLRPKSRLERCRAGARSRKRGHPASRAHRA